MIRYVTKRLIQAAVTLWAIVTLVFLFMRLLPVEGYFPEYDRMDETQIQAALTSMGLDAPIGVQLGRFYGSLLRGDLGESLIYRPHVKVAQIIAEKAPVSIAMGLSAMALSLAAGIPLGMAMAQGGWAGRPAGWLVVFLTAVPSAVYHLFLQLYGTAALGLPMLFSAENPASWILPVVSMSLGGMAFYALWLKRYMADEAGRDYVRLARAEGLPPGTVTRRHVLRCAVIPLAQYLPTALLTTLAGSVYVESLYSVPGMGGLLVEVIRRQDPVMVQALVLIYSALGVVGLLLGDLLMAALDPRVRLAGPARQGKGGGYDGEG